MILCVNNWPTNINFTASLELEFECRAANAKLARVYHAALEFLQLKFHCLIFIGDPIEQSISFVQLKDDTLWTQLRLRNLLTKPIWITGWTQVRQWDKLKLPCLCQIGGTRCCKFCLRVRLARVSKKCFKNYFQISGPKTPEMKLISCVFCHRFVRCEMLGNWRVIRVNDRLARLKDFFW